MKDIYYNPFVKEGYFKTSIQDLCICKWQNKYALVLKWTISPATVTIVEVKHLISSTIVLNSSVILLPRHQLVWHFSTSLSCIPWQQSHSAASDWSPRVIKNIGCSIALVWLKVQSSLNHRPLYYFCLLEVCLKKSDEKLLWLWFVPSLSCKHHFIWSDTLSH